MAEQPVTVVLTCRKYADELLNDCVARINTYAPCLKPYNVLITGDDVHTWSDSVRMMIEKIHAPLITVLLDDYYITHDVMPETYQFCVDAFEHPSVQKFDLSKDRTQFPHVDVTELVIESCPQSRYRSSLQAAIWRKEYLLNLLKPGRTPWEFELMGEKECYNDGAVILGLRTGVIEYDNVMLKGKRVK